MALPIKTTYAPMDALQQVVERKCAAGRHHDFAVEYERLRLELARRLDDLREVARERLAGLGLQLDLIAVAKHQTAKAVPLRLVLPLAAMRHFVHGQSFHRRKGWFDWQRHMTGNGNTAD